MPALATFPNSAPDTTSLPEEFLEDIESQEVILRDYCDGLKDIFAIATSSELTVDQLLSWINSEHFQSRLRALEQAAERRAETLARLHRPKALERLAELLRDRELSPEHHRRAATTLARECAKVQRESAARTPKGKCLTAPSPPGGVVSCAPHETEGAPPSTASSLPSDLPNPAHAEHPAPQPSDPAPQTPVPSSPERLPMIGYTPLPIYARNSLAQTG